MKNRETWLAKERRQNPFAKLMDVENIIVIAENYICVVTDAAPMGDRQRAQANMSLQRAVYQCWWLSCVVRILQPTLPNSFDDFFVCSYNVITFCL